MKKAVTIPTPHFDRVSPQSCINGKLRKLQRIVNAVYQPALTPFGLRGSMLSILFVIGKQKRINQKTLSEILFLDPSTMSRDMKKLQEKGWVLFDRGDDQRNSVLSLSRKGYQLLEEVSPVWQKIHEKVGNLLGQYQLQVLDQITHAVQSNLQNLKEN